MAVQVQAVYRSVQECTGVYRSHSQGHLASNNQILVAGMEGTFYSRLGCIFRVEEQQAGAGGERLIIIDYFWRVTSVNVNIKITINQASSQ